MYACIESVSVFRKQASERVHTRRGGACRAGERDPVPNKHEAHFPIVYPVPSPICSLFSGRRLKVPPRCMHACTERKVVWKDAKNGAVKSRGGRPSFRLLVLLSGLSRVFHPPSPLSTLLFFLLLFSFLSSSLPGDIVFNIFLRVFNWLPFRRVFVLENFNKRAIHPFVPLFSFLASFPPLCYHGESGGRLSVSFRRTPAQPLAPSSSVPQLSTLGHTIDRYPFPLEGGRWIFARQQDISGGNRPATLIDAGTVVTPFLCLLNRIQTILFRRHTCLYCTGLIDRLITV